MRPLPQKKPPFSPGYPEWRPRRRYSARVQKGGSLDGASVGLEAAEKAAAPRWPWAKR